MGSLSDIVITEGLAARIRAERAGLELTQAEFAKQAKISPATAQRIERPGNKISRESLEAVARFLRTTVVELQSKTPIVFKGQRGSKTTEDKSLFARNIRDLMNEHGLTPVDLAKITDSELQTVGSWLRGSKTPADKKLGRLAKRFGIPVTYFWTDHTVAPEAVVAPQTAPGSHDNDSVIIYQAKQITALSAAVDRLQAKAQKAEALEARWGSHVFDVLLSDFPDVNLQMRTLLQASSAPVQSSQKSIDESSQTRSLKTRG